MLQSTLFFLIVSVAPSGGSTRRQQAGGQMRDKV